MSEKRKYKMVLGEDGRRHRVYLTDTTEKADEVQERLEEVQDKLDEFDEFDIDELKEIEELDLEMLDLDDDFSFIDKERVKREFKKSIRRYRIKKAIKLAINIIIYIFAFFALLVLLTKK